MKSKRVFILAYTRQNLGDDLFICMLLTRYPNIHFFINIEKQEHSKAFQNFHNLTIYQKEARTLNKENAADYDAYVYIGGSIFMEGIGKKYILNDAFLEFMQECKKKQIPFFYISSNFGPYKTNEYLELAKKVYQNCTNICFRDTYSASLFSEVSTVGYAPDLAFLYMPKIVEKYNNSIGITIIDLSIRKTLRQSSYTYYTMLEKNIKEYIRQGKIVILFSFCKYEGDEKAIEELVSRLPQDIRQKIKVIIYDGNIEYFLQEYSKMEYAICSRFHAMVLSVVMGQKCEIISYSSKILNVIEDLKLFKNNILQFENLTQDTKIPIENFEKVEKEKIQSIAKQAKTQFKELDKMY